MACARNTVAHWRTSYAQHGLAGLSRCSAARVGHVSFSTRSTVAESSRWPPAPLPSMICPASRVEFGRPGCHPGQPARPRSLEPLHHLGACCTRADLKPHHSVYWLNSHDPDFDAWAPGYWPPLRAVAGPLSSTASWSSAVTKRRACKSSSGNTPHNRPNLASPRNASGTSTFATVPARLDRLVRGSHWRGRVGLGSDTYQCRLRHPHLDHVATRFADYQGVSIGSSTT